MHLQKPRATFCGILYGLSSMYTYFFVLFLVNVLLCCHFCVMATNQRRHCPCFIALEILNKVLNDASSGDETLVQQ